MELTLAKTEVPDPSKRGNSLFGELDDRRQKLENHIRYLKNKYDIIRKQNEENQKRIYNLKVKHETKPISFNLWDTYF